MMISTCSRDEVPDSDGDERPVDRRQAGHLGQSLQRTCPGVCPCGSSTLLSYICPCGGGGLTWWGGQQDGNEKHFIVDHGDVPPLSASVPGQTDASPELDSGRNGCGIFQNIPNSNTIINSFTNFTG